MYYLFIEWGACGIKVNGPVQILYKVVYISYSANTFGKDMNLTILSPARAD